MFYKKPPESSRDYLNELKVLEVCEFFFALRCHMCILWSSLKAYLILSAARPLQGTQTGLLFHRTSCEMLTLCKGNQQKNMKTGMRICHCSLCMIGEKMGHSKWICPLDLWICRCFVLVDVFFVRIKNLTDSMTFSGIGAI